VSIDQLTKSPPPRSTSRISRPLTTVEQLALSLIVPVVILMVWHLAVANAWVQPGLFPSPIDTAKGGARWVFGGADEDPYSGQWLGTVLVSGKRVVLGFLIASVSGVILGVAMARSRIVAAVMEPLFHVIRPIPIPAWIPFTLIFFGINIFASVALIVLAAFPPVVINTMTGVSGVDRLLLRAARMLGASRVRILATVIIPAALPSIFAGLRLAAGMSWLAVVVSELVGVQSGIGYTIFESYNFNRVDILITDMLTVGALGLLSDRLISGIGSRLTSWAITKE